MIHCQPKMPITSQTLAMLPSIDNNKLLERCMGNCALVEKLRIAFLSSLPSERNLLQDAIEICDLSSIASIAHKLRGTASNMCAIPLSEAAHQVEQVARNNEVHLIAQRWLDLNQHIEKLIDALSVRDSNQL